jgi:NAD(P)-dependent dehydrogenase (short-subunit alcohol dehydrogenase family)
MIYRGLLYYQVLIMSEFNHKIVIVTGGAKGIGRSSCLAFAEVGATVVCADSDAQAGEKIVADAMGLTGSIQFATVDMADSVQCQELVAHTVSTYGGVDILFNNVGIQPLESYLPAHEYPEELWDRIIAVNLKSYFLMSKYCIPQMLKRGGGVIINNASVQGLQSEKKVCAYAASKGGILSLTRQLALEYAENGIRVLAVCPGAIDTPMLEASFNSLDEDTDAAMAKLKQSHPLGRIGAPSEVAEVVLFLASEKASFMTGEYVCIDGGLMAKGSWSD